MDKEPTFPLHRKVGAHIVVAEKENGMGTIYFAGNVALNQTFTATASTEFKASTYFRILSGQGGQLLQLVEIHTSCSAPIVTGEQVGSMRIESVVFKNNYICGQVTPPGPNCLDCNITVNVPITVIDCACVGQGGDTDGDGVCNNQDCAPLNPNLPTTPGTACNDGNPNTINDVIQADGCSCAGTPALCNLTATFTVANGCLTDAFFLFADANDPYFYNDPPHEILNPTIQKTPPPKGKIRHCFCHRHRG